MKDLFFTVLKQLTVILNRNMCRNFCFCSIALSLYSTCDGVRGLEFRDALFLNYATFIRQRAPFFYASHKRSYVHYCRYLDNKYMLRYQRCVAELVKHRKSSSLNGGSTAKVDDSDSEVSSVDDSAMPVDRFDDNWDSDAMETD